MEFPSPTSSGFNTQPPEGGWPKVKILFFTYMVSTHSRLKAAGAGYGNVMFPS